MNPQTVSIVADCVGIVQGVVIIGATLFTVWWTYGTFAHKERMVELKAMNAAIYEYHLALTKFCAQVRESDTPDDREIQEKLGLARMHNQLVGMYQGNLYLKRGFRVKVMKLVGGWLVDERTRAMQGRMSEGERAEAWKAFGEEYEEVLKLVDEEAASPVRSLERLQERIRERAKEAGTR